MNIFVVFPSAYNQIEDSDTFCTVRKLYDFTHQGCYKPFINVFNLALTSGHPSYMDPILIPQGWSHNREPCTVLFSIIRIHIRDSCMHFFGMHFLHTDYLFQVIEIVNITCK